MLRRNFSNKVCWRIVPVRMIVTLLVAISIGLIGCGGGDDFSQPPADLAAIRARASQKAADRPAATTPRPKATAAADKSKTANQSTPSAPHNGDSQDAAFTSTTPSGTEPAAADTTKNVATVTNDGSGGSTEGQTPTDSESMDKTVDTVASASVVESITKAESPAETVDSLPLPAAVTNDRGASKPRTAEASPGESKSTESTSVKSLLDQLSANGSSADPQKKSATTKPNSSARPSGRQAIAARMLFKLRNDLAKQFYVAVTHDGMRMAATSGSDSVGVVSVRPEQPEGSLELQRPTRSLPVDRRRGADVATQTIAGLPATITAIELLTERDVIIIGADDGRLLARSTADRQDWDIYAQDLFLFQDGYRPVTRVAASAINVVRRVGADLLLIDTAADGTHLYRISDVVHDSSAPSELSEQTVRAAALPVKTAAPRHTLDIPDAPVVAVSVSTNESLLTIVTADGRVSVFDSTDGRKLADYSTDDFDQIQPVAATLDDDQMRLFVGLADGRIVLTTLPSERPDSESDTQPESDSGSRAEVEQPPVSYEVVYAPEDDRTQAPVSALSLTADCRTLLIGVLDGSLIRFDVPGQKVVQRDRPHRSPIVEIRTVANDVISRAADRSVRRSSVESSGQMESAEFRLPIDQQLQHRILIEGEDFAQEPVPQRRNKDRQVAEAEAEARLARIRPADPVVALYEHQLRAASTTANRNAIRTKLLSETNLPAASDRADLYEDLAPRQVAEIQTEFDFATRPVRPIVMSLSDDGSLLAVTQPGRTGPARGVSGDQEISVWDTFARTRLRLWNCDDAVEELRFDLTTGRLLPTPLSAQLELFTGRRVPELRSGISSAMSHSGDRIAMGLSGRKQTAATAVQIQSQNSTSRLSGLEAFEGAATAVAWSHDDSSLFVNLRERGRIRLLELASNSLQMISEISVEAAEGRYDPDQVDLTDDEVGATWLLPSPQGRYLVTYGKYPSRDAPYQLRIWKKKSDRWPQEDVKVLTSRTPMIESEMTDTPFQFVGEQDSQLAVAGPQGVGIIDLRTGSVKDTLELPDVANRRPITLFSDDGQWLLAGDQDGNVWTWNLRALQRDPRKLEAQAGPIMGMCLAPGQRFLATVGEENRLRIWTVSTWLKSQAATSSSASGRLR